MSELAENEQRYETRITLQFVVIGGLILLLVAATVLHVDVEEAMALCAEQNAPLRSYSSFSFTCGPQGAEGVGSWEVVRRGPPE